jgi:hypothetical protein
MSIRTAGPGSRAGEQRPGDTKQESAFLGLYVEDDAREDVSQGGSSPGARRAAARLDIGLAGPRP